MALCVKKNVENDDISNEEEANFQCNREMKKKSEDFLRKIIEEDQKKSSNTKFSL